MLRVCLCVACLCCVVLCSACLFFQNAVLVEINVCICCLCKCCVCVLSAMSVRACDNMSEISVILCAHTTTRKFVFGEIPSRTSGEVKQQGWHPDQCTPLAELGGFQLEVCWYTCVRWVHECIRSMDRERSSGVLDVVGLDIV